MSANTRRCVALSVKKIAYLLVTLPLVFPIISMALAEIWGHADLLAWGTAILLFVIVPLLDHAIGRDTGNPDENRDTQALSQQHYYRNITLLFVPAYALLLTWAGWVFIHQELGLAGKVGWILSVGIVGGLAITVAHELIHKQERLEQNAGGILLALVCYGGFKVEHLRGHHVHVSTPRDASSAPYDQSLYQFLPHAYRHNFRNAWQLEFDRLRRLGRKPLSVRNELIWWYLLSAATLAGCGFLPGPEPGRHHAAGDRQLPRTLRAPTAKAGGRTIRAGWSPAQLEFQLFPDQHHSLPAPAAFRSSQ